MSKFTSSIPATHSFVYNDKEYSFNFDIFKYFSDYMKKNQQIFQEKSQIPLLNENEKYNLTENSIKDFINFCQNKDIIINNENAVSLSILSQKYEVTTLLNSTKQYIIDHHDQLLFDIYLFNLTHIIGMNFDYEKTISDHISDYIKSGKLISLPLSSIYRIISLTNNIENIPEIFPFIIQCINNHGKKASILLKCFNFDKVPSAFIDQLIKDFSEVIDINYIKGELYMNLHQQQQKIIDKQNEQNLLISNLQSDIEQMKKQVIIFVAFIIPQKNVQKDTIDVGFISDFNTKDIQINVKKYEENDFFDIVESYPNFIDKFNVIMVGCEGYQCYSEKIYSNPMLVEYRNRGGSLLFLHDFNSAYKSKYGKPIQPFSDELGFIDIRYGDVFNNCEFVPNKDCGQLQSFPFKIKSEFNVSDAHETPIYNKEYILIQRKGNEDSHYYCENKEKRVADCTMGHTFSINLEEKKLLYNILYHLSQL